MWKAVKRSLMRWYLRRKFGPMVIGSQAEINEWIERVVRDRIP